MFPSLSTAFLVLLCFSGGLCFGGDSTPSKPIPSSLETSPWNFDELSKSPEFEWAEGKEVRSLYFKSEPYRGKQTRVFAYYASPATLSNTPAGKKRFPGIVLVHGGKGRAYEEWVKLWASRGYAAIAMDLGGKGPVKGQLVTRGERQIKKHRATILPDGGPRERHKEKFGVIDQPVTEQWTYHAVANVIRAHSLIRSFSEVDPDRMALTGISWGGYLTCIVAGIDNRFKAAVPVYGCGFLHENSFWRGTLDGMSAENRTKWIKLWDPSQYVGSATMPMLFVNGGKDFAYPPDSHAKTYALVKSPKNLHFVPNFPHGHFFDRPKAIEVFIRHHLKNGVPLAKIGSPQIEGELVKAPVDTKTKLIKAELHYTLDALPGNPTTRKWVTQPATIETNTIIAKRPPAEAKIWLLTVTDEDATLVSSQLMFPRREEVPSKKANF